jgi:hypothetical protein
LVDLKIKSRSEVLNDVIKDAKKHPKGWKAVLGNDNLYQSRDYYIVNPDVGVYFLKEFEKNPFELKGVGSKIARQVDEDIDAKITKYSGNFGIIQGDIKKITNSIIKGIKPEDILGAAIKQSKKDYGIRIPMKGKASSHENTFKEIRSNFSNNQKKVDQKFEKLAKDEGLYNSYD